MAPGFLAVLSEPGNQVSLDEFHDWYDNEHIPLRLNHLPSFLSGARYRSIDGVKPSWIAVYEIDDTKTFSDQSYTVLREKRSQREEDVMGRLEVLDRRTCEVVREVGEVNLRTTGLKVGNPSQWVVTHGVGRAATSKADGIAETLDGDEFKEVVRWINEVVTKLESNLVGGWVKTRVLKVLESAKTGTNLNKNGHSSSKEEQSVLSYFVFHGKSSIYILLTIHGLSDHFLAGGSEFVSEESANSPTFREIIEENSKASLQFSEFRQWELYKSYPCVAQGNVNLKA